MFLSQFYLYFFANISCNKSIEAGRSNFFENKIETGQLPYILLKVIFKMNQKFLEIYISKKMTV